MGQMFAQFFVTFTTLFAALNKFAATIDNLGTVAEETSQSYVDEARVKRQMQLNQLNKELATTAPLPAIETK